MVSPHPHRKELTHRRKRRLVTALLTGSIALLIACGDSDTPKSTERPLTFEEAGIMAELLYDNYSAGGATFTVNTVTAPGGAQLNLSGEVDWKTHQGWADVTTNSSNATLVGVMWGESILLERRPVVDNVLIGMGVSSPPLISRAPNLDLRLDQVIAVVTGLAATQRDNAQLIMQAPGSAFVRDDILRGTNVHVFRYGTRNLYWVNAATGTLMRLEATSKNGGLPTIVELLEIKAISIPQPDAGRVVRSDAISEIYQTLGPL